MTPGGGPRGRRDARPPVTATRGGVRPGGAGPHEVRGPGLDRQAQGDPARAAPGAQVRGRAGPEFPELDAAGGQGPARLADLGRGRHPEEGDPAVALVRGGDHPRPAVGLDQQGRLALDADAPDPGGAGLAPGQEPGQERGHPAVAALLEEVRLQEHAAQVGQPEEVAGQGHAGMERVAQGLGGHQVRLVGPVLLRRVDELPQDGQARAGAADGDPPVGEPLDRGGHRRPAPEGDVPPLVPPGDPDARPGGGWPARTGRTRRPGSRRSAWPPSRGGPAGTASS